MSIITYRDKSLDIILTHCLKIIRILVQPWLFGWPIISTKMVYMLCSRDCSRI